MAGFTRARPEDVERFNELAAGVENVELRKMFGYPAAFVGGNLAFALYADRVMLRLPEPVRRRLLAEGWQYFEPIPNRVMREYLELPSHIAGDPERARDWLQRAADHALSLPPKATKRTAKQR